VAELEIGRSFAYGRGVAKDQSQAAFWYRKAAEQGNAEAQYELGFLYLTGDGLTKNEDEAKVWLAKAAKQGDSNTLAAIDREYVEAGRKLTKNAPEALKWYAPSADRGGCLSQFSLGLIYAERLDVPNLKQAYKWLVLAEKCSMSTDGMHKLVVEQLAAVKTQMTQAQIKEAKLLVDAWKPNSVNELNP
jgi:TPR repeat protein